MRRSRKPTPQTIAVVLALADNPSGWSHGCHLCRQLGLKAGTVYPILMRLAERGQVETAWETIHRRAAPPDTCTGCRAEGPGWRRTCVRRRLLSSRAPVGRAA